MADQDDLEAYNEEMRQQAHVDEENEFDDRLELRGSDYDDAPAADPPGDERDGA